MPGSTVKPESENEPLRRNSSVSDKFWGVMSTMSPREMTKETRIFGCMSFFTMIVVRVQAVFIFSSDIF